MDAAFEILMNGVVRTTLCTTLAALVVLLFLPTLGITSPRTHRIAWALVLIQGWLLLPLTFTVSAPPVAVSTPIPQTTLIFPEQTSALQTITVSPQTTDSPSWRQLGRQVTTAVWLLGTMVVLAFYLSRYYLLVRHIPLGAVSESEEWNEEWSDVFNTVSTKKIHFRVTQHVGPLLCYVPFVYLVLVPRQLWSSLRRNERIAILRHEVAHFNQCDLWKNLAVRILALPQWFNPLVWIAVRRFEEAGEWACDEAAVAASDLNRPGYADALVRVAGFSTNPPCGTVSASGGVLTRRVKKILSSPNTEVSHMKNLFLPLLLLIISAGQVIRIESVQAEEPRKSTSRATRTEAVAKWKSEPYLIEPPDVLSIKLKYKKFLKESHQPDEKWRLEAEDINFQTESIVGPEGHLSIGFFGAKPANVSGMTLEQAKKTIASSLPKQYSNAEIIVDVAQSNSKAVYIIQKNKDGDFVLRVNHTGTFKVLDALAHMDCSIADVQELYIEANSGVHTSRLDIDMVELGSEKNVAANVELIPGDRLFVQTTTKKLDAKTLRPPAGLPTPVGPPVENHPSPVGTSALSPVALPTPVGTNLPSTPVYAPPVYAPPAYAPKIEQVKLSIQVIEDLKDSFTEIDGLRDGDSIIGDAQSTLGLIRALSKNQLARIVASPTVVTGLDRPASVSIDTSRLSLPISGLDKIAIDIKPSRHNGGTSLATTVSLDKNGSTVKYNAEVALHQGQTCIMRVVGEKSNESNDNHFYVALTREYLR